MPGERGSTNPGYINRNGQMVLRPTGLPGTDHMQKIYVLRCSKCTSEYGANGSEIFQCKCPACQGGAAGLAY
jgi:PHP family Zn ribbon phosphoesterase